MDLIAPYCHGVKSTKGAARRPYHNSSAGVYHYFMHIIGVNKGQRSAEELANKLMAKVSPTV